MRRAILFCWLSLLFGSAHSQSVLASGDWYRIGITGSGIYKLDRSFLSNLGMPVGSLDPRTVKVYGYGGGMLPQANDADRPEDLPELSIWAMGESDGELGTSDYFLFYGQSPDRMVWNETGFQYEKNFYSDTTYYFITYGGANGKRIETLPAEAEQPDKITEFDDALLHEVDERNLQSSGRRWLGEMLSSASGTSRTFNFTSSNVLSLEEARLTAAAESRGDCSMQMTVNGNLAGAVNIAAIPNTTYGVKAREATGIFALSGANENISVTLTFQPNGSVSIGYVDWFAVQLTRALQFGGNSLPFRSMASTGQAISSYRISSAPTDLRVWDVTDPMNVAQVPLQISGGQAVFSRTSDVVREFMAFQGSSFPTPVAIGTVENQSLRSISAVDALIVSHPLFLSEAQRLADFHASHDGLNVAIVTPRQVYNEFSSGRQDVSAIRDFARHAYTTGGQLKYLLLFGDASYDYKNRAINNNNLVPIYQSRESFHPIFSHSSDDYYGFLEDHEGEWEESLAGDHTLEIGVGRIPANTPEEARTVVDKIIRYSTSTAAFGPWRNKVIYVSDDGDGTIHMQHGEALSGILEDNGGWKTRKLYLDSYDQEIGPQYEEAFDLNRAIVNAIDEGALFFNFIGHGNEEFWMDERVFRRNEIESIRNYQKLPVFVTATCEFGRYDNPIRQSGAESLLLRETGAIALLTTTRLVFANTNFVLNQAFHNGMLQLLPNPDFRLGDLMRETKNNALEGPVNRNFALLGDPMLRPSVPGHDVVLDGFEDEPVEFSALKRITLTGGIQSQGLPVDDFSGKILVEVYDIPVEKITKGSENAPFNYVERDNVLFRGEATVTDGTFSLEFIVPKNISYKNEPGRISLYAWDENSARDAGGMEENLLVGGTNQDAPEDTTPPTMRAYINEPNFKNGSRVGPGAVLIARLEDESGMNVSNSGFDRGITLDLNGQMIELNEYYTADTDDFTKGTVVYPLKGLEAGSYTARIKATDVYNNPVERRVDFTVSNQPILQTFNFKTYPNPAKTFTRFAFEHDREGEPLEVHLTLYGLNGERVIHTTEQVPFSARAVEVPMDLTRPVPKDGMYVYSVVIRSLADGAVKEHSGRLVIGN